MSACTLGASASCFTCAQLHAEDSQARVGEGHFRQRVHWVHRQVVSDMLSSMLKILKQEAGEGQFCQRVHWVYLQNSFTCAQLYAEDSQAKGGCGSVLSASTLGV